MQCKCTCREHHEQLCEDSGWTCGCTERPLKCSQCSSCALPWKAKPCVTPCHSLALAAAQVLVGNKSDMDESKRAVPYSRGQALADEFRMQFFETSAKNNTNVDEVFQVRSCSAQEGRAGSGFARLAACRPSRYVPARLRTPHT